MNNKSSFNGYFTLIGIIWIIALAYGKFLNLILI